jgi:hypothetical protein
MSRKPPQPPSLYSSSKKTENRREDRLDRWQYRIFKVVLFIIAVYTMWQFLNAHVPVGKALSRLFGG